MGHLACLTAPLPCRRINTFSIPDHLSQIELSHTSAREHNVSPNGLTAASH
jgi:hypothetical protein